MTFAHAGVDHASKAEAAAHGTGTVIITIVLISAAVIAMTYFAVQLLKRWSVIEVPAEKEGE